VVEVDVSPAAYNDWHIDGAVLWNVYADLKDSDYRTVGIAALEKLVARSGIGPDSTVVFYGYAPALGLWLMKLHGHPDVRILDCSRDTWRAGGHPWSTATSEYRGGLSGPPAAWSRSAAPDTCHRLSTGPSTAFTTPMGRSAPPQNCAVSSHRPVSTAAVS
jgi:3-mercaptopyruvate sulfurtransferase SseA